MPITSNKRELIKRKEKLIVFSIFYFSGKLFLNNINQLFKRKALPIAISTHKMQTQLFQRLKKRS